MTKAQEILEPLSRPLDFAARNDFSALGALRDIEKTFRSPLVLALEKAEIPEKRYIEELLELVKGIDGVPLDEKKRRLRRVINIHKLILEGAPPDPPPPQTNGPSRESAKPQGRAPELSPDTPIKYVKGVGPVVAEKLAAREILTVGDALRFYPRAYEDRRNLKPIGELREKETATVLGTIVARGQAGRRAWEMVIKDAGGYLSLKWFQFNRNFLERLKEGFAPGDSVVVTGKVSMYRERPQIVHPEIRKAEAFDEDDLYYRRIVPLYSKVEGVSEGHFLRIMQRVVEGAADRLVETIPERVRKKRGLTDMVRAVREVHFPPDDAEMAGLETAGSAPRKRLLYEEYFFLQLGLALRKAKSESVPGIAFKVEGDAAETLRGIVPFELTTAQKRVIREVAADMARPAPMNRLLQGDVGSGKTAVAFAAMLIAVRNGFQAAMLAPTEILAAQHHGSIGRYASEARRSGLDLKVALLTASTKGGEKAAIFERMSRGELDIVVGTHAVLEDKVEFKNLGMAVIDEQHRFGVMQRAAIRRKGGSPDVLVMTATPIPRTLALSLYGDLDLSVIDELPPGRTPVTTKVFFDGQQQKCFDLMEREIRSGRQCYVVYPLVEESEKSDLKDATRMAEEFRTRIFPHRRIGLLHGRMRDDEKNDVMSVFKSGAMDVLVSTTVIEVGVDVPNASVMVVEHAERFGLSQLHQLRGRVGRGAARSYCLLVARYNRSEDAERRLRTMEKTTDGFIIAEEDLAIRGPGEFTGVRQSGLPDLMMSGLKFDSQLLSTAREDAFELVRSDPGLSKPENRGVREQVAKVWAGRLELSSVG